MDAFRFAAVVRGLNATAESLAMPVRMAFRSPPHSGDRSIRRAQDGTAVISVRLRDRPDADVLLDLVAGVMAANRGEMADAPSDAERLLREAVWSLCVADDREDQEKVPRAALGLPDLPSRTEHRPTDYEEPF